MMDTFAMMVDKTPEEKVKEVRRDLKYLHASMGGFVEALSKFCEAEQALNGLAGSLNVRESRKDR